MQIRVGRAKNGREKCVRAYVRATDRSRAWCVRLRASPCELTFKSVPAATELKGQLMQMSGYGRIRSIYRDRFP